MVWFIGLTAYQLPMGYFMQKSYLSFLFSLFYLFNGISTPHAFFNDEIFDYNNN